MFLLVPAHPGSPGQRAVKWLLLLLYAFSTLVCTIKAEISRNLAHLSIELLLC